jgi:hypothetical protein
MSASMSSCPPTSPRRPASTKSVRGSTPKRSAAASAWRLRLLGQPARGGQVAHHQESDGIHAEFAGGRDVVCGDVGFGAVGPDAHHAGSR